MEVGEVFSVDVVCGFLNVNVNASALSYGLLMYVRNMRKLETFNGTLHDLNPKYQQGCLSCVKTNFTFLTRIRYFSVHTKLVRRFVCCLSFPPPTSSFPKQPFSFEETVYCNPTRRQPRGTPPTTAINRRLDLARYVECFVSRDLFRYFADLSRRSHGVEPALWCCAVRREPAREGLMSVCTRDVTVVCCQELSR